MWTNASARGQKDRETVTVSILQEQTGNNLLDIDLLCVCVCVSFYEGSHAFNDYTPEISGRSSGK